MTFTLRCVLLTITALGCHAQSFRPFTVGALQCGLVKRDIDTVQVYCYGPNHILYSNTIYKIGPGVPGPYPQLTVSYNFGTDAFSFAFNVVNGSIFYQFISYQAASFTGTLTDIFAAVGDGCGMDGNLPRSRWDANGHTCITLWAASDGAWKDCCVG